MANTAIVVQGRPAKGTVAPVAMGDPGLFQGLPSHDPRAFPTRTYFNGPAILSAPPRLQVVAQMMLWSDYRIRI